MNLPTIDQIENLHEKYAPSQNAFDLVFTHCQIIWDIAKQLIENNKIEVDQNLIKVGCLLHDIGVYKLYLPNGEIDHLKYISHGWLGYKLLKEEGMPEEICRFALHHTGVGISKQEIIDENLPLPAIDIQPKTKEERLVMYADKFHSKSQPPFKTFETYKNFVRKFGEDKVKKFEALKAEFGEPDLEPIAKKYRQNV